MNRYRVFHLGQYVKSYPSRDAALNYVYSQRTPEDYEILDRSDDL